MRFTIRDLLWLMVVIGMGWGWWLHVRAKDAFRIEQAKRYEAYSQTIWEAVHGLGLTADQLEEVTWDFNAKWGNKGLGHKKTGRWDVEASN